jgi:hypothetical protein
MLFLLFVLHDTEKLARVLEAWEKAGVTGITILPSISLAQIKEKQALQEDFPIIPNLEDIEEIQENQSRTLIAIVPSQEMVDTVYNVTINILGLVSHRTSGIFIVLPVIQAYGLGKTN